MSQYQRQRDEDVIELNYATGGQQQQQQAQPAAQQAPQQQQAVQMPYQPSVMMIHPPVPPHFMHHPHAHHHAHHLAAMRGGFMPPHMPPPPPPHRHMAVYPALPASMPHQVPPPVAQAAPAASFAIPINEQAGHHHMQAPVAARPACMFQRMFGCRRRHGACPMSRQQDGRPCPCKFGDLKTWRAVAGILLIISAVMGFIFHGIFGVILAMSAGIFCLRSIKRERKIVFGITLALLVVNVLFWTSLLTSNSFVRYPVVQNRPCPEQDREHHRMRIGVPERSEKRRMMEQMRMALSGVVQPGLAKPRDESGQQPSVDPVDPAEPTQPPAPEHGDNKKRKPKNPTTPTGTCPAIRYHSVFAFWNVIAYCIHLAITFGSLIVASKSLKQLRRQKRQKKHARAAAAAQAQAQQAAAGNESDVAVAVQPAAEQAEQPAQAAPIAPQVVQQPPQEVKMPVAPVQQAQPVQYVQQPAQQPAPVDPAERFKNEILLLREMGFSQPTVPQLLVKHSGNIQQVVQELVRSF